MQGCEERSQVGKGFNFDPTYFCLDGQSPSCGCLCTEEQLPNGEKTHWEFESLRSKPVVDAELWKSIAPSSSQVDPADETGKIEVGFLFSYFLSFFVVLPTPIPTFGVLVSLLVIRPCYINVGGRCKEEALIGKTDKIATS